MCDVLTRRLSAWRALARRGRLGRYVLARALAATRASTFFQITGSDYRLHFFPTSLSVALWVDPDDRLGDERFLRHVLTPGDLYVDVGANIGQLAVVGGRAVGPHGKVIAIEPHPRIFGYLRRNILLNDLANVTCLQCAIGDVSAKVRLSDSRNDDVNRVGAEPSGTPVQQWTLDECLASEARVTLLKVDVEGYEIHVLKGAEATLDKTDCVLVESFEEHFRTFGRTTPEMVERLCSKGFAVFRFDRDDRLVAVPTGYVSERCENLVAVRPPFASRVTACRT